MGRNRGMPAMILQYVLNNKGYVNGENIVMDYSIEFGALGPALRREQAISFLCSSLRQVK